MRRAAAGFLVSIVIGVIVGSLVSRIRPLRAAFGSLITGIQTMPSVAWVPFALLLFGLDLEKAIMLVMVLGAAPSIANGIIQGSDHIPPVLLRAGRVLGARGFAAYRHVVLPAAMPSFVGGLKQGWAFLWRSLMAAELIAQVPGEQGIGQLLNINRNLSRQDGVMAMMIVILVIGIAVDALVFSQMDKAIRRRWGLIDVARLTSARRVGSANCCRRRSFSGVRRLARGAAIVAQRPPAVPARSANVLLARMLIVSSRTCSHTWRSEQPIVIGHSSGCLRVAQSIGAN